jgi:hypothetical protein
MRALVRRRCLVCVEEKEEEAMKNARIILCACPVLLGVLGGSLCMLSACGDAGDDGSGGHAQFGAGTADEQVGTVKQALNTSWNVATGAGHNANVYLGSASDQVCVLTYVSGQLNAYGHNVDVRADSYGNWWLTTGTGISYAEAHCFGFDAFLTGTGTARWLSSNAYLVDSDGNPSTSVSTNMWWGDATTFLSGIDGTFSGFGERGKTFQSGSGFTASTFWLGLSHPTRAAAYSFFAGTPGSGVPAKFYNNTEYSVSLGAASPFPAPQEVRMAPEGDAMCHFTSLSGNFSGAGETAAIYTKLYNGVSHWYLYVQSGNGGAGGVNQHKEIAAKARCFLRQQ